jgi:hypothetical protein
VLAGEGGVRFLRQESPSSFTDVTAQTKLPAPVLHSAYTGAWAIDVEADGDMDILLGTTEGIPIVLRNNGDGSFTVIHPFTGISGLRGFAWVDLDSDGNPDAAMIDGSGKLHFLHNERGGVFRELALPGNLPHVRAVTVADVGAGTLALVAVEETGALVAITRTRGAQSWNVTQLGTVPRLAKQVRVRAADVDNNGVVDLLVAPVALDAGDSPGALLWLGNSAQKFTLMPTPFGSQRVFDVADLNGDGICSAFLRPGRHSRPQIREAKSISGRSFGREHAWPPGISALTPSALAGKWNCVPVCWCRSSPLPRPNCISAWGNSQPPTW